MKKVKIGFLWSRGNILKEQYLLNTMQVQSELQGIDLYKIRSVFERVMKRPVKEITKVGRPKRTIKPNPLNF